MEEPTKGSKMEEPTKDLGPWTVEDQTKFDSWLEQWDKKEQENEEVECKRK